MHTALYSRLADVWLRRRRSRMHHDQAAGAWAGSRQQAAAWAAWAAASNCAKGKAPALEGVVLSVGDNALKNGQDEKNGYDWR